MSASLSNYFLVCKIWFMVRGLPTAGPISWGLVEPDLAMLWLFR